MNAKQAIRANPFGTVLASYKNADRKTVCCVFNSELDATRWINFNKDYAQPFSGRIIFLPQGGE